jgi:hypothetical protein
MEGMKKEEGLSRQLVRASLRELHRLVDHYVQIQDYSSAELLYSLVSPPLLLLKRRRRKHCHELLLYVSRIYACGRGDIEPLWTGPETLVS